MLVSTFVNTKQNFFWLRQWNQFGVIKEAQKFPKHGFLDANFDKWLQRAIFRHQEFDYLIKSIFFSSIVLDLILRIPIIFELDKLVPRFLQLEVEAIKLFDSTIRGLHVTIDQLVNISSFIDYIHKWRLQLWELAFYKKFKIKGGITRGNTWELQIGTKKTLKHVFYK